MNNSEATPATTADYDPLHDLSPKHLLVLDALDSGSTHEQAAAAAGVHRVTVTKWATKHPAFIAERNRRANERARLVAERVESVTTRAIEVVGNAIEEGNLSAAFTWLKQAGSLNTEVSSKPSDPSAVLDAIADRYEADELMAALGVGAGMRDMVKAELRAEFEDDEAWLDCRNADEPRR